jgi:hypothetical protein
MNTNSTVSSCGDFGGFFFPPPALQSNNPVIDGYENIFVLFVLSVIVKGKDYISGKE